MRNILAISTILMCVTIGCSTYPDRISINNAVESGEINPGITSNDSYNSKKQLDSSYLPLKNNKLILTREEPCRIKYHKLSSISHNIVIEGNMGIDGNKYPVILDTGASQPVVLNAALVRNNNLPIYDMGDINQDFNGQSPGICQLSKLDIGDVTLEGWPCIYFESHSSLNLFGIPIASSTYGNNNIILGLPLLREFKYLVFDNINKEVEMSYHQSFEPYYPEGWKKYPILIEEDFHDNAFLFVRINIAGHETELQLDTGSGRGMAISETLWKYLSNEIEEVKLKKGKDFYPYIGNLPCKKGEISKLIFGDRTIDNAEISVFRDDCPLLDGCEGLVGMQYFSSSVFVLDFEHELMWIKEQDTLK